VLQNTGGVGVAMILEIGFWIEKGRNFDATFVSSAFNPKSKIDNPKASSFPLTILKQMIGVFL
jgi:hypothetical protein